MTLITDIIDVKPQLAINLVRKQKKGLSAWQI